MCPQRSTRSRRASRELEIRAKDQSASVRQEEKRPDYRSTIVTGGAGNGAGSGGVGGFGGVGAGSGNGGSGMGFGSGFGADG